jgi:hypothetical protein
VCRSWHTDGWQVERYVKPRARGVFEGPADLAARADEHLTESGFGDS